MAIKKDEVVAIKPIREKVAVVKIEGTSPLIVHNFGIKGRLQLPGGSTPFDATGIEDTGLKPEKRAVQSRMEAFIESMYWISGKPAEYTEAAFTEAVKSGARFGFPVAAFKRAAIDAAYTKKWVENKVGLRGAFFIEPDGNSEDGEDLVEILGDTPVMREDIVRIGTVSKVPDLRWRAQFTNWYAELKIRYDANGEYSLSDICNILNAGGHYNGVGEWRPQKNGQYGSFKVVTK